MEKPHSAPESAPLLLVVDDREENLEAMQALLGGDESWALRLVASGEEALRCLLREDVSLVLLDVQMPGMDGYEVAELMRANPNTRHTPIIFISAIAHTQDSILRGYHRGAVDFILKPFDPLVLRQKIHNLLGYENNRRALLRLNQQLERERAFNDQILNYAAEGIMVVDADGVIDYANPAMGAMLGKEIDALKGENFLDLFKYARPDEKVKWQNSPFYRYWQERKIYRLHEGTLLRNDAAEVPVTLSCAPLPRPQKAFVAMVRDIATEQELRQRLEALIITDPLTGLLNRRGFYQATTAAIGRAKRNDNLLAILYIDLDRFKNINDSLGHDAGDDLLCHVASQIKAATRSYDMLARMGGDEFTVLLDGLKDYGDAAIIAEKLIKQIAEPYQLAGEKLSITASIGIACYGQAGEDVDSLLRAADMAMYEAKKSGRKNYRFHSSEITQRTLARLELQQRLTKAVEHQNFTLAYQPQFYLETGQLRGFEALLRWPKTAKEGGNITALTPDQFIPHLEETRLIQPLGQWIFNEGLARLVDFRARFGKNLVLSINVSPIQFSHPELVDNLAKALRDYNLDAAQLELEVTEGILLQNLDITQVHLRNLRKLGVSVAVDDFGTGYSSLAYLRQFDVDVLKIDRLFIANMLSSPRDAAVVSTILDLSRHLNLQVVAEGVETQDQRQWLLQHNCAICQGYLVAPGLPFDEACQMPSQLDWQTVAPYMQQAS